MEQVRLSQLKGTLTGQAHGSLLQGPRCVDLVLFGCNNPHWLCLSHRDSPLQSVSPSYLTLPPPTAFLYPSPTASSASSVCRQPSGRHSQGTWGSSLLDTPVTSLPAFLSVMRHLQPHSHQLLARPQLHSCAVGSQGLGTELSPSLPQLFRRSGFRSSFSFPLFRSPGPHQILPWVACGVQVLELRSRLTSCCSPYASRNLLCCVFSARLGYPFLDVDKSLCDLGFFSLLCIFLILLGRNYLVSSCARVSIVEITKQLCVYIRCPRKH